ncbi:MAG TPA: NAD(P)/FAD-dependent oxidoreductase [Synechococcales cyanobacterium M55_K2018_004]|nr:NAD(P)/FAD-dependent oxidoreductase [Synechococcales cyanobacterium M55_K2018_004]
MNIAIIGGGMMGLTTAYRLSKQGHQVTVFESAPQLGGLATHHDYGPFVWDRFYHVILPSDQHLIGLLREIGLGEQLRWQKTLTGFYANRKYYSVSNTIEFLRFPALNLLDKVRLAFTLLYGSRINNWRKLEQIPVEDWLVRLSGRSTYEKFWEPLLRAKLGEYYQRVSAVFIWSYIKRLFSARDSSLSKEQLGYVQGGYKTVFERLATLIHQANGNIRTGVTVEYIGPAPNGGLLIEHSGTKEHFDKVFFTGPVNILQRVAARELFHLSKQDNPIDYLGVICMVLITRKPLVPFYIVNIADQQIPFTGVIGMSNIVALEETAGFHITYLPKYIPSDDPLLQQPNEEIKRQFASGIRSMFPDLKEEDVLSVHINRATKVQPMQVLNYSQIVPQVTAANKDFFVLNTSQFLRDNSNNNAVVRHVTEFFEHGFL